MTDGAPAPPDGSRIEEGPGKAGPDAAAPGRKGCLPIVLGMVVVAIGIVLLPCPGPGMAVIGIGLGMMGLGAAKSRRTAGDG